MDNSSSNSGYSLFGSEILAELEEVKGNKRRKQRIYTLVHTHAHARARTHTHAHKHLGVHAQTHMHFLKGNVPSLRLRFFFFFPCW